MSLYNNSISEWPVALISGFRELGDKSEGADSGPASSDRDEEGSLDVVDEESGVRVTNEQPPMLEPPDDVMHCADDIRDNM